MEKSKNLFGFIQIEADNRVDNTFILERLEKNLKSIHWNKVSTPIQQTVLLTS